jgi:exosome complex component RRP4
MSEFLVEKYQLVTPGDKLATGKFKQGFGVFKEKASENTYDYFSTLLGLVSVRGQTLSVIPLEGSYIPLENDLVIGIVANVGGRSWIVDIRGPYSGVLALTNVLDRDFRPGPNFSPDKYLNVGEIVLAKVISFDRTRDPMLTMHSRGLKKLTSGRLFEVDPVKVPRIIGKNGSMISMIKDATKSQIYVGQNGRVLINAPNFETEKIVIDCIDKIQKESHVSGLTDRIKALLQEHNEILSKN